MESGLTLTKSLQEGTQIFSLKREDEGALTKTVYLIVKRFQSLVNVGKPMNDDQMITLASDLIESFQYGETLEDIMLFFKMARKGEFGQFHRLDQVVIMGWLPSFLDRKAEAREKLISQEKGRRLLQEKEMEMNDKAREKFEELSRKIGTPKTIRDKPEKITDRNTPLFNYQIFLQNLQSEVGNMEDGYLKTMFENTSKFSNPEVWEILNTESELRKTQKSNSPKTKKNSPK